MINFSGVYPVGNRILIKPDVIEESTAWGFVFTESQTNKEFEAQVAGRLVACGLDCWEEYEKPFAQIGDRVLFAKWHGNKIFGRDGEEYRILNDIDITAVIDDDLDFGDLQSRQALNKKAEKNERTGT